MRCHFCFAGPVQLVRCDVCSTRVLTVKLCTANLSLAWYRGTLLRLGFTCVEHASCAVYKLYWPSETKMAAHRFLRIRWVSLRFWCSLIFRIDWRQSIRIFYAFVLLTFSAIYLEKLLVFVMNSAHTQKNLPISDLTLKNRASEMIGKKSKNRPIIIGSPIRSRSSI